ncbi:MAG: tRNA (adenosine(37)-N6)-threonylcarbamoyltransferase complex ATPase subunit type 1 TsaE [Sulfurimonas sp. RIFCSPHIGHO2_12_FULL_36_9]|uniref:tRNA (adenosine(37)-N6)-threonylcarbamoyltransferase complex ATPase subunit type 1 TsaE n=1 Tax=Sulfurimonas sp. RIFCSPLOWO2_12_36_12 TaxID=1802253 RepID=UPI0008AE1B76|nr:tRNA (adenosine(37)-N6)-threonylcarbamoyltransferase complex ATPase subunit type 1 TsaE [Sulfurimonas sp. RIFCSPLOWO2_12_36_12]OHD87250.1 MAG: tRNA (adenosine(37)-N6)-threonylcarbamoyltransferase complex ATPase subunit type 1 TsaE [Sulfuricurvum sp. RIFCSPLOWO2_02_43_6]OHD98002.1 MAG: tRNA (adenosine(37)-N6)-threonylcarbamoyltransferase complex ATPase subunit type 1 TsaE [Sulfurimonas sp. RIFCSPHIGHO2_12_FULL_36_9]OHD98554.1 MAG: tRNA (adenosine(37)-N6)-threonylcarbamoyltransferase complex AT
MKKYLLSLDEIDVVIQDVAKNFSNGVIVLRGDLAAGKTTFVKKMVKFLGVDEEVTSPTFSLQHCYGDKIFHYDMYNHGLEHFISLGMLEELERDGLHFVEWGDDELVKILNSAEIKTMVIDIEKISDNKREYKICTY